MPVAFVARDRGRRASRFYGINQSIPLRWAMCPTDVGEPRRVLA
jgi:hypothetical protein